MFPALAGRFFMTSTIWEATCVSTHTSKISLVFFVCVLHLPRFWYQDHNQNKKNPPRFQAQLLEMQNPRLHSRPMESISAFQQDPLVTYVDMSVRSCLRPCHLPETASSMGASQVAKWSRICLPMQETQETWVRSLGQEDPLEEEMATHSSSLAWRIP